MMLPIVAAVVVMCAGAVDGDCRAADQGGSAQPLHPAVMWTDCGPHTTSVCDSAVIDVVHSVDLAAAPGLAGAPGAPGRLRDAPAISLVSHADALQGAASLIVPRTGPRALARIGAGPGALVLSTMTISPTTLREALAQGLHQAAPMPSSRRDALWIGAGLWLMIAGSFAAWLLARRRGRAHGKYRPGSGVRLRERPHDRPMTTDWARRVHHTLPPVPSTPPGEEAPRPARSGSGRRRSASRTLHRRFSYSPVE